MTPEEVKKLSKSEALDAIASRKKEVEEIYNRAANEKRSMTGEEQEKAGKINTDLSMLRSWANELEDQERAKAQEEMRNVPMEQSSQVDVAKRFAKFADDAVNNRGESTLSFRANILNETSVHDASVPVIFQDLAKPFEKGLILTKVGVTPMYNVQGEPVFPEVDGFEASVLGENDAVDDSKLTFTQIRSTPKRFSARIPVSRRAVNQSNLDIYGIVMEALGMALARKVNHAMFDTAAHGLVSGPFVTLDPSNKITRTAATVGFDDIVKLEHSVLDTMVDALSGKSAYVMNTKMAMALKTTQKVSGQSEMVLDMFVDHATNHRYGMMNGYRVEFCNYVDPKNIMFADFRYCGIPQFGNIDIVVDPYTLANKGMIAFTLNVDMDIVKIRKEAFSLSTK